MPTAPYVPQNAYNNFLNMFNYGGVQPQNIPATTGTGTGGTVSLPGGAVSGYDPAYGGVPTVPSPVGTLQDVLGGNLGILGQLYNLTTGVSGASAGGAEQQLQQNLPGYAGARDTAMANTQSDLQGLVGQDEWNQLAQRAAERGVALGGTPDSPNANTALLAALGQTINQRKQQGQQNLTAAVSRTPTGPQFNPASMLLNPQSQQEWQYLANMLAAAPIPARAAAANIGALQRGIGQGYRPQSNTPFNFNPAQNPFAQPAATPFVGGTPSPGNLPPGYRPSTNQADAQYSQWLDEFLAGNPSALTGPSQGYADEFFPGLDATTPNYGGQSVADLFPGFLPADTGSTDFYNFGA